LQLLAEQQNRAFRQRAAAQQRQRQQQQQQQQQQAHTDDDDDDDTGCSPFQLALTLAQSSRVEQRRCLRVSETTQTEASSKVTSSGLQLPA